VVGDKLRKKDLNLSFYYVILTKMNGKAQAGLEYLMTYGWALIIITTIVGVLVFIASSPTSTVSFSSSDPTKILLKAGTVDPAAGKAEVIMQNITGGAITINSVVFSGKFNYSSGTTLNGNSLEDLPTTLISGGVIHVQNISSLGDGDDSSVTILYSDPFNFQREASAKTGSGGPADIKGAYRFEEVTATTPDNSGNMMHGVVTNAVLETVGCKSGNCLKLDGSGDYVDLSGVLGTGPYTKIAWVKLESGAIYYNVVSSYSSSDPFLTSNHFWAYTSAGRKLNAGHGTVTGSGGTQWYVAKDTVQLTLDEWHHVAVTFEPTAADEGILCLYKNGFQVARATGVHFEPDIPADEYKTYVGRWSTGAYYKGLIDEVKIFNRALSGTEITNDYASYS